MLRTFLFLSLLCAPAAFAQAEAPAENTPAPATPADAPKAEAPVAHAPQASGVSLADRPAPEWWLQAGAGLGAGLVAVPVTLYLASWVGTLSNNVYVSLVGALLLQALLPSLVVTAAVVGVGNIVAPGRYPFWRVWGATTLANIIGLVIANALQVNVGVFAGIALYGLLDALAMTGVATVTSRWLENKQAGVKPDNILSSLEPWNPGAPARWFVPTAEVSF